MKLAVTGATGYVGRRFIHFAKLAGHDVLALTRSVVEIRGVIWQQYNLEDSNPTLLPADVDVVIHLAAVTKFLNDTHEKELTAAKLLIDAASSIKAKFIFISSQTAHEDSPTLYGRVKWLIEKMTLDAGGIVIRPGQIYGGPEEGLFGLLCSIVKKSPILPAFIPSPKIQPIHVDDFVQSLLTSVNLTTSKILNIASPESTSFTQFLRSIARGRTGIYPIFIPIPVFLIQTMARCIGSKLSSKLGLDRLQSLFGLAQMNTGSDLQLLSLQLRPLSAGMTRSGLNRRELCREGQAILAYVLRVQPKGVIVRRYVKAIESLKMGQPLLLPEMILRTPALLALLDGNKAITPAFLTDLDWRLNAAMALAEASPQGYTRFLYTDKSRSFFVSFGIIAFACFMELLRRVVHLLLYPVLTHFGNVGKDK